MFGKRKQEDPFAAHENQLIRDMTTIPFPIRPGQVMNFSMQQATTILDLAKKTLSKQGVRSIYKDGEGSRLVEVAYYKRDNGEVSDYLAELSRHGLWSEAFQTWYNLSPLQREVMVTMATWPALIMMNSLKDKGFGEAYAVREASKAYVSYTEKLADIDLNDINDSLPYEALPIVSRYLANANQNQTFAEGLRDQLEKLPSMNAWVRFQILETIG